jgi:putative ABC transport system permease protein
MASLTKGDIKTAVHTLQRNKFRSMLTMLGVIIGVASVVTVVGIGEGVKQQINAQTEHLGKDLITIRPGQLLNQSLGSELSSGSLLGGVGSVGSLTNQDIDTVSKTPGVASSAPLSLVSGAITSSQHSHAYNAYVVGTNQLLPAMLHQGLAFGSFFSDNTSPDNVVIGSQVAQALFSENVPLGQTITILGQQFVVEGIFNDFQAAPLSLNIDFDNAVFIPYSAAELITNNDSPIYEILARPQSVNQTAAVAKSLQENLLAAHGGQHNFTVLEQSQTLMVTDNILSLLTALIGGVAAIALLVGGIGIMNVMLVSITERMHEVGIRKAVGATDRQILSQFMIEAAVLSVTGGFIGIVLSFVIEVVLRLVTSLSPSITWQIVVLAFVVSVGIGLLFGTIPALQAARKDPIEALRNE